MSLTHDSEYKSRAVIGTLCIVAAIAVLPATGVMAGALPPGLVDPEISGLQIPTVRMPTVDNEALEAEDRGKPAGPGTAGPMRFAVGLDASVSPANSGRWDRLDDGWDLWRVEIDAPGALSVNLRIEDLELPPGSSLWLHDPTGAHVHGPYTQSDRDRRGGLSTPIVLGDRMVVEVVAPSERASDVQATITRVHHGYRQFSQEPGPGKQGDCNIDVRCPEGDAWRDQIRSTARYTVQDSGSTFLCSGSLMNNTAEEGRPLFLTADHCGVREDNAHTVVVYWNFESPSCGDLGGGFLGQNQTGASFLSTWDWDWNGGSDFTLLELDFVPDASFNVYYAGWDVSGLTPQSVTGIHHPGGDEKAISFENDPLTTIGVSHWKVNDWDLGTTEPGSSGSCIFDQSNGLCVGTLSGGYAACGNDREDWYGQMHESWTGGGTPSSRLSDHLDPLGLGVTTLEGLDGAVISRPTTWLIPAAASTPGVGTSNWKTQIGVANPSSSAVTAELHFVAEGLEWPGATLPGSYSIPAGGALFIDDPLADLHPTVGLLYVIVDSNQAVVSTRTYNLGDDGSTFGQGIPGIPLDSAQTSSSVVIPLIHSVPDRFRTNLGIVQTSKGSLLVRVTVHDPSGAVVAAKGYGQNSAFTQINNLFADMGIGGQSVEGGWIEVQLLGGSPAFWTTYASVVDDQTGDPTYVAAVTSTETQWVIPAAASTPGVGTSNWKTQIGVANPSSSTVTADLYYVAKGSAWPGTTLPGTYSIPAWGALYIDDPLADFNPTSGLMYVSVDSSAAVVSTRTYNLGDNGATFGQGIPGIPLDTGQASPSVVIPMVHSAPNRFRTNLGIVQTSAGDLLTRVTIRAPSGAVVAAKTYAQTTAFNQINDIFSDMGVSGLSIEGGWIEVELVGGSPSNWTAYASVVDDQTGDPTYVAAVVR
ncbi:MAG: hypothetical protein KAJ78_01390 [Acidobacteria bacterium]|nr:hypothetical protein [Acidobacteriota bacterium]